MVIQHAVKSVTHTDTNSIFSIHYSFLLNLYFHLNIIQLVFPCTISRTSRLLIPTTVPTQNEEKVLYRMKVVNGTLEIAHEAVHVSYGSIGGGVLRD